MNLLSVPNLSFIHGLNNRENKKKSINVNLFSKSEVISYIKEKIRHGKGFTLATINLDHVVKLSSDRNFFAAYAEHDAVVADGFPIVKIARSLGYTVERTAGADIVDPIMALLEKEQKSLALVGTTKSVLECVRSKIKDRYPNLSIALAISPPYGFAPQSEEALDILKRLNLSGASVCFIALGAPKQEIFAARGKNIAPHVGFVSIGASLDFIAGDQKRAPLWAQKYNVEWLWRLCHDPRRLFFRYIQCACILPFLFFNTVISREKNNHRQD